MPYIEQHKRAKAEIFPVNPGELNFFLTRKLMKYIRSRGESYSTYNEVLGVLESVKQELYRRRVAPYEDEKIEENGDVY